MILSATTNICQHRKDPINSMAQPRGSTADPGLDLTKSYSDMHELSRHIDHITEALRAAKSTMDAITVDCSIQFQASPGATDHNNGVRFWALFIANLEHRAVAFNDRLENEISLVCLLFSVGSNFVRRITSSVSCNSTKHATSSKRAGMKAKTLPDMSDMLRWCFFQGRLFR
jgi:hypothetical protein